MHGQAAVAGIGESTYYVRGRSPDSEFKLCCTAITRAAEDAGVALADIDGIVSYMDQRNDPLRLAHALGLKELRWAAQTCLVGEQGQQRSGGTRCRGHPRHRGVPPGQASRGADVGGDESLLHRPRERLPRTAPTPRQHS